MVKGKMYCPYCSRETKVYYEFVENRIYSVCSMCDRTLEVNINNKCAECEHMEIKYHNDFIPEFYCKKLKRYIQGDNSDFWCKK